jgi:hypothetical protein
MRPSNRLLLTLMPLLCLAVPAGAQTTTDPSEHLAAMIDGRAKQISALRAQAASRDLTPAETPLATVSLNGDVEPIYLSLVLQVSKKAQLALEQRRADKQVGDAGGSTAGSTSLVSKGGTPAILALAVENGALAQDVSGTTVTLRGTPATVVKALGNTGYFETLKTDDAAVAVLQRLSFAVSFDTSRGVPDGGQAIFTADRSQFSAASLRFSAIDNKDPRAAVNDPRWNELTPATTVLNTAALAAFKAMQQDPAVVAWVAATDQAIKAAPLADVEEVVVAQFRTLFSIEVTPDTRAAVNEAGSQFVRMLNRRAEVLRDIEGGAQLVFDLTYQKPAIGAASTNLKLVGSVGRSILLTGNGGITLNHGDGERIRDIQLAAQLDVPIGDPNTVGRFVLSLATKFQHMPNDLVADDGALFPGTEGTIVLGQVKLTIPVRGAAAKIPVSVTFANRTELISERRVFARANVGFSYDLDEVFARFKP